MGNPIGFKLADFMKHQMERFGTILNTTDKEKYYEVGKLFENDSYGTEYSL